MNPFERRVRELVAQQPEEFALDWVRCKFKALDYTAANRVLRSLKNKGELVIVRPGWALRTGAFQAPQDHSTSVATAQVLPPVEQHYAIFRQSLGTLRVPEIDGAAPAAHAKARP